MKKNLLVLFIVFLLLGFRCVNAYCYEVAVIKSNEDAKGFSESLEGFKSVCNHNITEYIISNDKQEILSLKEKINSSKPDIVYLLGALSLQFSKEIDESIPVVYSTVLSPERIITRKKNITGITLNIPAMEQLEKYKEVLPFAKTIGVMANLNSSKHLVEEITKAAHEVGLKVVIAEYSESNKLGKMLRLLAAKVDAVWLLPDPFVINYRTVKFLYLYCFDNQIPLIVFSKVLVETGGLMSYCANYVSCGKQAGDIANGILNKTIKPPFKLIISPNNTFLELNTQTAQKIGVYVPYAVFETDVNIYQ